MEFSTKIVCFSKGVSLANMNMKRVTLVNIISNVVLQVVTIISGFIIPKLILLYFGSNVNGLVSSLNQFLGYISLLEGGITGVVSANFYKPLIENDTTKLSAIVVTAKSFFDKMSRLPVTVIKKSPNGAASSIGMTSYPSMSASKAFTSSISVTMTRAPRALARMARPLPHQP